jgi:hypothetical protein
MSTSTPAPFGAPLGTPATPISSAASASVSASPVSAPSLPLPTRLRQDLQLRGFAARTLNSREHG